MNKFNFSALSPRKKQMLIALGIFAIVIVLAVVGVTVTGNKKKSFIPQAVEKPVSTNIATPGAQVDAKAVWMGKSSEEIKTLQDENKEMKDKLKQLEEMMKRGDGGKGDIASQAKTESELAQRRSGRPPLLPPGAPAGAMPPGAPPGGILPSDLDEDGNPRVSRNGVGAPKRAAAPKPTVLPPPPGVPVAGSPSGLSGGMVQDRQQGGGNGGGTGIFTISLNQSGGASPGAVQTAVTQQVKIRTKDNYLPSGAFVRGILLSGLDAPTGAQAQGNPTPTLIRLTDLSVLPNRQRFNIKECFVVGAGYGDLSSERAYIRTESLSCVMADGHVVDQDLKGFVADSSGKAGVRGRLVTKQGQVLANALLAGVASGIGNAFAQSQTTTSISPLGATQTLDKNKIAQAGVAEGFHSALDRLAQYYIRLAEQLFPILEVDAGRQVDIVVTKGTFFDDDSKGAAASAAGANPTTPPAARFAAERTAYAH